MPFQRFSRVFGKSQHSYSFVFKRWKRCFIHLFPHKIVGITIHDVGKDILAVTVNSYIGDTVSFALEKGYSISKVPNGEVDKNTLIVRNGFAYL